MLGTGRLSRMRSASREFDGGTELCEAGGGSSPRSKPVCQLTHPSEMIGATVQSPRCASCSVRSVGLDGVGTSTSSGRRGWFHDRASTKFLRYCIAQPEPALAEAPKRLRNWVRSEWRDSNQMLNKIQCLGFNFECRRFSLSST